MDKATRAGRKLAEPPKAKKKEKKEKKGKEKKKEKKETQKEHSERAGKQPKTPKVQKAGREEAETRESPEGTVQTAVRLKGVLKKGTSDKSWRKRHSGQHEARADQSSRKRKRQQDEEAESGPFGTGPILQDAIQNAKDNAKASKGIAARPRDGVRWKRTRKVRFANDEGEEAGDGAETEAEVEDVDMTDVVAGDDDDNVTDLDYEEGMDVDVDVESSDQVGRPNRWTRDPRLWKELTHSDRTVAQAMNNARNGDIAVHLFNVFALKRHLKEEFKEQERQRDEQARQEALQSVAPGSEPPPRRRRRRYYWHPRRAWTAWPVPRPKLPEPERRISKTFVVGTKKHRAWPEPGEKRPRRILEELLTATILRLAKERFRGRTYYQESSDSEEDGNGDADGNGDGDGDSKSKPPRPLRARDMTDPIVQKVLLADEGALPTVSSDDDWSTALLLPLVRHVLEQLDAMLRVLHAGQVAGLRALPPSRHTRLARLRQRRVRSFMRRNAGTQRPFQMRVGRTVVTLGPVRQNGARLAKTQARAAIQKEMERAAQLARMPIKERNALLKAEAEARAKQRRALAKRAAKRQARKVEASEAPALTEALTEPEEPSGPLSEAPPKRRAGRPRKQREQQPGETEREFLIRVAREEHRRLPVFDKTREATRGPKKSKKPREPKESKTPRESGEPRESKEPKESKEPREKAQRRTGLRQLLRRNLRGWRDVMGAAALGGFDADVVARASQRCADLFGEPMALDRLQPAVQKATYLFAGDPQPPMAAGLAYRHRMTFAPQPDGRRYDVVDLLEDGDGDGDNDGDNTPAPIDAVAPEAVRPYVTLPTPIPAGMSVCPHADCPRARFGFTRRYNLVRHLKLVHAEDASGTLGKPRGVKPKGAPSS